MCHKPRSYTRPNICQHSEPARYLHEVESRITSVPPTLILNTLCLIILIDTALRTLRVESAGLGEIIAVIGTVNILLEDRIGLNLLELGLEVFQTRSIAGAVGATACIRQAEAFILDLLAVDTPKQIMSAFREHSSSGRYLPAAFTSAVLLHLLRVCINVTRLCEIAREMFRSRGSPISQAGVVTVIELVRLAHCWIKDQSAEERIYRR